MPSLRGVVGEGGLVRMSDALARAARSSVLGKRSSLRSEVEELSAPSVSRAASSNGHHELPR